MVLDAISDSLLEYVVNCFLAVGYDVITAMQDISENPGNSIKLIEKYILLEWHSKDL